MANRIIYLLAVAALLDLPDAAGTQDGAGGAWHGVACGPSMTATTKRYPFVGTV